MKVVSAAEFFDAIARRYDRDYALGSAATRERMARVVAALPPAPATVLDLGVGTGRELGALLDAGHAPTGLDASEAMLAICARRARPVPLVKADFWKGLPFEDASFDACVALHGTLAHPPEPGALRALAGEVARVVKAEGVFVAEAPSPEWIAPGPPPIASEHGRVVRVTSGRFRHVDERLGVAVEGAVWTEEEWRSAFEGRGFEVEVEAISEAEWVVLGRKR
jgi:SAM-dependent methyltransferase